MFGFSSENITLYNTGQYVGVQARDSVVDWGCMLQGGSSKVSIPDEVIGFFN
jgi:hypothetical protein